MTEKKIFDELVNERKKIVCPKCDEVIEITVVSMLKGKLLEVLVFMKMMNLEDGVMAMGPDLLRMILS